MGNWSGGKVYAELERTPTSPEFSCEEGLVLDSKRLERGVLRLLFAGVTSTLELTLPDSSITGAETRARAPWGKVERPLLSLDAAEPQMCRCASLRRGTRGRVPRLGV